MLVAIVADRPVFSDALPDLARLKLETEIEVTERILSSAQECIRSGIRFEGFELALRMGLDIIRSEQASQAVGPEGSER
jgi:hypothetical protein